MKAVDKILLVLSVVGLVACAGPGELGFGTETLSGTSGGNAAAPTSSDGSEEGTSETGGAAASPTATIPVPNVRSEYTIVYAVDDSNNIPYVGYEGAADYDESYKVVASTEEFDSELFVSASSTSTLKHSNTYTLGFARSAYADDFGSLCDELTWTPVNTDGSFEMYIPTNASVTTIYSYIGDENCLPVTGYDLDTDTDLVVAMVSEPINTHALWLAQAPKALALAGASVADAEGHMQNHFGALGQDMVVQIKNAGGVFSVMGNYTNSYHDVDALNAAQIGFDTSSNMTLLEDAAGIDLFTSSCRGGTECAFYDTGANTTVANTEAYTMLKLANNTLMFGRDRLDATSVISNSVFNALDVTDETIFIDGDLIDSVSGDHIQSDRVISFDVDENGCALVVFSDNEGNLRIRASYVDAADVEYHFGGESALSGTDAAGNPYTLAVEDFKDFVIYSSTLSSSVLEGKALLLDQTRGAVWTLNYRFDGFHRTDPTYTYITAELDYSANATAVGNGSMAIALNANKNRAYVLNETDATVSVLRLTATSVTNIETLALADTLSGKDIALQPNSITFYANEDTGNDYVLVGDTNLKGFLTIDVTPAPITPVTLPFTPRPPRRTL